MDRDLGKPGGEPAPQPAPDTPEAGTPRERAITHLLTAERLDQALPRFLSDLSRIIPFDWALLETIGLEGEPVTRSWSAPPSPAMPFRESGWHPGVSPAAIDPGEGPSEVSNPFLLASLKSRGLRRALQVPLAVSKDETATLLLGRETVDPFSAVEIDAAAPVWTPLAAVLRRESQQRRADLASVERSAELSALFEIMRTAGRAVDAGDLFFGLGCALQPVVRPDVLMVLLEHRTRRTLTFFLARPVDDEVRRGLAERFLGRQEDGRGALGTVEEIQVRHLVGFDPSGIPLARVPESMETYPLNRRSESVGMMGVVSPGGPPTGSMARVLAAAAGQASLTLDRLESEAEAQAVLLRGVIDSMSDGVVLTDGNLGVRMLNPAAREHMKSLSGEESPGSIGTLAGVSLGEIAGAVLAGRRGSASLELTVPSPRRFFRLVMTPIAPSRGFSGGLVVVTSDMTEARALQEQMLQTEKLSALGELISGIAHELNNPLATVMGYAQLLQTTPDITDIQGKLNTLFSEARRCQNIVRNLLTFARKHPPEWRLLSVNEVLQSVLGLMSYQLRSDGIDLVQALDPALPPVSGDFHQLQQVFLNLISNAHHALKENPSPRSLAIRTFRKGDGACVVVEDNGPGIDASVLQRVFEPFFTTKESGKGTGLGLSIAQGTVRKHRGEISVRSEPGSGTSFTVVFPGGSAAGATVSQEHAEIDAGGGPSRRILVVEDEEALSRLLEDALVAEGHRVDRAPDGVEARKRLARSEYDLIITDLKMPRTGGRELFEEVVASRPELARRFIFATGDVISRETRDFFEAAGRPVLAKPFDVRDLRRLVRQTIRED